MEGCSNAPQNDPEEMIKATVAYMSPSQILKLPKAGERRTSYVNRKIGKTVILSTFNFVGLNIGNHFQVRS